MHPFSTPWKHKKTGRFSHVLAGRERVKAKLKLSSLNSSLHFCFLNVLTWCCVANQYSEYVRIFSKIFKTVWALKINETNSLENSIYASFRSEGLKMRSKHFEESQNDILWSYFNSISPSNAKYLQQKPFGK